MSKNKRLAARKRKKALKRAERKRRRMEQRMPSGPSFREVRQATATAMEHVVDEEWLDEWAAEPDCTWVVAKEFVVASREVAERLEADADDARDSLAEWPDEARTCELRTLLLELVDEAARDAAKWRALAARFDAIVEGAAHHVHIDHEGRLVDPTDEPGERIRDENPF